MPPLRSSYASKRHHNGFTLIEILVVILIIGITLGFAMMAFGDFGKERKIITAAEEFSQFLSLAHEKALLESSTLRLQLKQTTYALERLSLQQQWQPISSSIYRNHVFPSGTQISVQQGSKKDTQLTIIFDSSGDMTPFLLYIGSMTHPRLVTIEGQNDGRIIYQMEARP